MASTSVVGGDETTLGCRAVPAPVVLIGGRAVAPVCVGPDRPPGCAPPHPDAATVASAATTAGAGPRILTSVANPQRSVYDQRKPNWVARPGRLVRVFKACGDNRRLAL